MAKIRWSYSSIEDIQEISSFIAQDSTYYAKIVKDRILELVEHLELFPELGRNVPESDDPNVRELFYKSYSIIYQIKDEYLEIITIVHGSRLLKWPSSYGSKKDQ